MPWLAEVASVRTQDVMAMNSQEVVATANDKFHPLLNQALQDVGLVFIATDENHGEIQGASCARRQRASLTRPALMPAVLQVPWRRCCPPFRTRARSGC